MEEAEEAEAEPEAGGSAWDSPPARPQPLPAAQQWQEGSPEDDDEGAPSVRGESGAALAGSLGRPLCSGALKAKCEQGTLWRAAFYILLSNGALLRFRLDPRRGDPGRECLGSLRVRGARTRPHPPAGPEAFALAGLGQSEQLLHFRAPSQAEARRWVAALDAAGCSYGGDWRLPAAAGAEEVCLDDGLTERERAEAHGRAKAAVAEEAAVLSNGYFPDGPSSAPLLPPASPAAAAARALVYATTPERLALWAASDGAGTAPRAAEEAAREEAAVAAAGGLGSGALQLQLTAAPQLRRRLRFSGGGGSLLSQLRSRRLSGWPAEGSRQHAAIREAAAGVLATAEVETTACLALADGRASRAAHLALLLPGPAGEGDGELALRLCASEAEADGLRRQLAHAQAAPASAESEAANERAAELVAAAQAALAATERQVSAIMAEREAAAAAMAAAAEAALAQAAEAVGDVESDVTLRLAAAPGAPLLGASDAEIDPGLRAVRAAALRLSQRVADAAGADGAEANSLRAEVATLRAALAAERASGAEAAALVDAVSEKLASSRAMLQEDAGAVALAHAVLSAAAEANSSGQPELVAERLAKAQRVLAQSSGGAAAGAEAPPPPPPARGARGGERPGRLVGTLLGM